MNDLEIKLKRKISKFIDPVQIIGKYASFSTVKNDVIFNLNNIKEPIFCGGIIKAFSQKVYNFKINEFVSFISYYFDTEITLSSNLIFKVSESNLNLIFILPYASYAMKILRYLNPKLNQNILLIGLNFFSLLLLKLIKLSGVNAHIIKMGNENENLLINQDDNDIIDFNEIKKGAHQINRRELDKIILLTKLDQKIIILLKKLHASIKDNKLIIIDNCKDIRYEKEINLKIIEISKFDKGFLDLEYKSGIKYPYPYIRWDFRRNLEYFIYLVKNKKINIDFFRISKYNVNSLKEIVDKINLHQGESLLLFKIQKTNRGS